MDLATAAPASSHECDSLDQLKKLVSQETRFAVRRQPEVTAAADAMLDLLRQLEDIQNVILLEFEISPDAVNHFQKAYHAAKRLMTDDLRFALRPAPDGKLVYFNWTDAVTLCGETYCDILVDDIATPTHREMGIRSDFGHWLKANASHEVYTLKPKKVVTAWPEISKNLAGATTAEGDPTGDREPRNTRFVTPRCPRCSAKATTTSTGPVARKHKCTNDECRHVWSAGRAAE